MRLPTLLVVISVLQFSVLGDEPTEKDLRSASNLNLRRLGVAMHTHHDVFKLFPAQSIRKDDKALLSWRVKLLPYVGEQALYDEFHLDEPWDSDHNKTLIPKMPPAFASPYETAEMVAKGLTAYQLPLSKGALFEEGATYSFDSIKDGASHTILVVETEPEHAVTWTKPEDWRVDPKKPHSGIVRQKGKGFHVLFADGAVHLMDDAMDAEKLLLLIGKDDEKSVTAQTLFLKE